jgi:predicted ribosome quality control (RQC) complex YloA/Tae2 family protein
MKNSLSADIFVQDGDEGLEIDLLIANGSVAIAAQSLVRASTGKPSTFSTLLRKTKLAI